MLQRLAAAFAIFYITIAFATEQDANHSRQLLLRGHIVDTTLQESIKGNLQLNANEPPQHFVIQFTARIHPETKAAVRDLVGHDLTWYIPHYAFVIYTTTATIAQIQSMDGVVWTGVWKPEFKYVPESSGFDALEDSTAEPLRLIVMLSPTVDLTATAADLRQRADKEIDCIFRVTTSARNRLIMDKFILNSIEVVTSHQKNLVYDWFAKQPAVYQIAAYDPIDFTNFYAKSLTQDDDPAGRNESELLFARHGIFGEGQIIGIGDSGIAESSCFFHDSQRSLNVTTISHWWDLPMTPIVGPHRKLVQYVNMEGIGDGTDMNGHGTHVAGTLAGQYLGADPKGFSRLNGAAPRARIAFFDMEDKTGMHVPLPLNEAFFPFAYLAGARVHSNSWGTRSSWNLYTIMSHDVDQFVYDNPNMLIVFAAGNSGDSGVTPPATAKNAIAVGSTVSSKAMLTTAFCSGTFQNYNQCYRTHTENNLQDHVSYFSSIGPTSDGRIKPDLMASGEFLISAGLYCNGSVSTDLQVMQGTSMAAPNVAGHMLLVREYLIRGFLKNGVEDPLSALYPSAALLKAIAITGSFSVGLREQYSNGKYVPQLLNAAPDSIQGFGSLKLNKILYFVDQSSSNRILIPRGEAGSDPVIREGEVHSYCFRTTNSSASARFTLVWTDVPAQPIAAVSLVQNLDLVVFAASVTYFPNGGNDIDTVNTVERIQLPNSIAEGIPIMVQVIGSFLPVDSQQRYALVASGSIAEISCDGVPSGSLRGTPSPSPNANNDQLYSSGSQPRFSNHVIAWTYVPLLIIVFFILA